MRKLDGWRLGAVLMLLAVLAPAALAQTAAESEMLLVRLKAAYVYKLTSFVDWPAAADRPFVIGVIGAPRVREQLAELEQAEKRRDDRPIRIQAYAGPADIAPCEILFVGEAAAESLPAIARRLAGRPTLLVGDIPGGAGRGLAIELFRKPDILRRAERLRLRIDPKAIADRGLVVSAQLYEVAEVIP
ncbi:YfiR family protein [Thiorhodococcus mannitoliphagus]|uniref:YfiR family protein n=1 Tax=Thiorhodococcus mannitoliphagus TaxID=329406 RepID=A0A6P1DV20_9GAMM|nr:YfiR family protein [Thiorhodococcus mannitoliphagus]NEX21320.1 YfiR family protein [Thiorhodococcus mannitoliphagus]